MRPRPEEGPAKSEQVPTRPRSPLCLRQGSAERRFDRGSPSPVCQCRGAVDGRGRTTPVGLRPAFYASDRDTVITRGRDVGLAVRRGQTAARRRRPIRRARGGGTNGGDDESRNSRGQPHRRCTGCCRMGLGPASAQADPDWATQHSVDSGVGRLGSGLGSGSQWGSPGQIKNAWCPWNPPGHWKGGPHGSRVAEIRQLPLSDRDARVAYRAAAIAVSTRMSRAATQGGPLTAVSTPTGAAPVR